MGVVKRAKTRLLVALVLFIFILVANVAEDLLVVAFATDQPITWGVIGIAILVSLCFAVAGELVVHWLGFD